VAGGVSRRNPSGDPVPLRSAFIHDRAGWHLFGETQRSVPNVLKDLNKHGVAAGGNGSAFVYDEAITPIPGLTGFSAAHAINEHGDVAGVRSQPRFEGFVFSRGTVTGVGTLGGAWSQAWGINRRGDVVGASPTASSFFPHAYLLPKDGELIALPMMGGRHSTAHAINDRGEIVGQAENENLQTRAALWRDGAVIDLGTLGASSTATGINNRSEVIGLYGRFSAGVFESRPFLWREGRMIDLAALPELAAAGFTSWVIMGQNVGVSDSEGVGVAINNHGQIAGVAVKNGEPRLFVLAPLGGSR
jgi:probable HAF family extracellular repeat protein